MKLKRGYYHLFAVLTVVIWGSTFISTKILIQYGLSPQDIFFYRFLIAYVGIWFITPFPYRFFARTWRDELWLMGAGVFGGSAFFVLQNTAIGMTQAANVSFIICTAPLLTALLSILFYRSEKATKGLFYGSLLALLGVGLVVFNGSVVLKISPLGDLLTLLSALLWAFYSLIVKKLGSRYSMLFVTRKVFFYGVVTLLPVFLFRPLQWDAEVMMRPVVWGNLLFLAVFASLICFVVWNIIIKQLGAVKASNYIYLNPLVTMIASLLILGERVTPVSLAGVICISLGVYWAQKR